MANRDVVYRESRDLKSVCLNIHTTELICQGRRIPPNPLQSLSPLHRQNLIEIMLSDLRGTCCEKCTRAVFSLKRLNSRLLLAMSRIGHTSFLLKIATLALRAFVLSPIIARRLHGFLIGCGYILTFADKAIWLHSGLISLLSLVNSAYRSQSPQRCRISYSSMVTKRSSPSLNPSANGRPPEY